MSSIVNSTYLIVGNPFFLDWASFIPSSKSARSLAHLDGISGTNSMIQTLTQASKCFKTSSLRARRYHGNQWFSWQEILTMEEESPMTWIEYFSCQCLTIAMVLNFSIQIVTNNSIPNYAQRKLKFQQKRRRNNSLRSPRCCHLTFRSLILAFTQFLVNIRSIAISMPILIVYLVKTRLRYSACTLTRK